MLEQMTTVLTLLLIGAIRCQAAPAPTSKWSGQTDTPTSVSTPLFPSSQPVDGLEENLKEEVRVQPSNNLDIPDRRRWLVALETGESKFVCGAAIISARWLLTAAHCLRTHRDDLFASIGVYNLTAQDQLERIPIDLLVIHSKYNRSRPGEHDIALLRLAHKVTTVNVPPTADLASIKTSNAEAITDCVTFGWGRTSIKQSDVNSVANQRSVSAIENAECQRRWRRSLLRPSVYPQNICTDESTGMSACQGDSGSPMVCRLANGPDWTLVGLTSWGSAACTEYPSVYMRISAFTNWISDNVKN